MIDCMVLYDKLAQFETSAEIAEFLEEYGIKGKRMVAKKCALSIYFQTLSGFETSFCTYSGFSYDGTEYAGQYECTAAMTDFIVKFDRGRYPQLLVEGEVASAVHYSVF